MYNYMQSYEWKKNQCRYMLVCLYYLLPITLYFYFFSFGFSLQGSPQPVICPAFYIIFILKYWYLQFFTLYLLIMKHIQVSFISNPHMMFKYYIFLFILLNSYLVHCRVCMCIVHDYVAFLVILFTSALTTSGTFFLKLFTWFHIWRFCSRKTFYCHCLVDEM